ncbi:protein kinase domain-containing protein [Sorangium sp. So ce1389]|uniref:serine/threonine-protein kinase n=1 Tax=Sorangium sp. So ce1389 TaxID=3133336 RepID=UPI003F60B81D
MSPSKSSTLLASGVLIDRKYRLVRQIGEGAMGVVWSAVNVATAREVALKLIHRPEAEFRLRLQREARNCGALRHRNVIDIYDMGETEAGEPFLVMQLLTGETVAELLARRRKLEPGVAASIGRDVARGLAAAHAMHIIHRDLKPANIFLHREPDMDEPVVKVLDFGVAKNLSVNDGLHTVQGGAVGSPLYMSPEQVRAEPNVDHRADIWALGVVLFEMLTGVRPFQGDAQAVFMGILTGEIPTVSRYLRRVDQGLVDLIARCMRRDRAERIGSAAEIAAQLDRYAGRGVDAASRQSLSEGYPLQPAEGAGGGGQGAQPGSGSAVAGLAGPASIAEPSSVSAGALPLALLGGGPRAPVPLHDAPGSARLPSLNPGQLAALGQPAGARDAAGVAPRRAGSSEQIIAVAPAERAAWDDDVATLPLARGSAEAAGAARQRAGSSGQYPAAGSPVAALMTPLPSAQVASAVPGLAQASAAQPAAAQPAAGAMPERAGWGSTVRMAHPPVMPERMPGAGGSGPAGAGGSGPAAAPTTSGTGAPSGGVFESTVKLGAEAGASASDSRPGATTGTGAPGQTGSSSTTPLVSNHPLVHQTGAHAAQDARDSTLHGGDDQKRRRTAATLAITAAALSLIVVGMLIALRSGETSPAAPESPAATELPGSVTPPANSAGGDTGTVPERGGALPQNQAPTAQSPEAPPGSAASPTPVPPAPSALPVNSAGVAPGGSAGAAPGSSAGAATGRGADTAVATASSAKPRPSSSSSTPAAPQPPKPPSGANPCAALKFMEKKMCEAKLKK